MLFNKDLLLTVLYPLQMNFLKKKKQKLEKKEKKLLI